jgi:hypothetical protein
MNETFCLHELVDEMSVSKDEFAEVLTDYSLLLGEITSARFALDENYSSWSAIRRRVTESMSKVTSNASIIMKLAKLYFLPD